MSSRRSRDVLRPAVFVLALSLGLPALGGPVGAATASSTIPTTRSASGPSGSTAPGASSTAPTAGDRLRVVLASPAGSLQSTDQATELRWLFDRPVVDLSSVEAQPDPAQFVTVRPAIAGSYRWVSTRALTFTPAAPLARSTQYTAVLAGLRALDGSTLAAPSVLRFETPRVSCQVDHTDGAWPSGGSGSQLVLRCDQPVDGTDLARRSTVQFTTVSRDVDALTPAAADLEAMQKADAPGARRLAERLVRLGQVRAAGRSPLRFVRTAPCRPTQRESATCHWLELTAAVPVDASAVVAVGAGLRSTEGPLPGKAHTTGEPLSTPGTPVVSVRGCRTDCDPEASFGLDIAGDSVSPEAFDRRLRVRDLGSGKVSEFVADRPETRVVERRDAETGEIVRIEETDDIDPLRADPLRLLWAGLRPGRSYRVEIDPGVRGDRGQELGYTSLTTLSLGNAAAYISLPSGERVLEKGKAAGLRVRSRNVTRIENARRKVSKGDLVRTVLEFSRRANGEVDADGKLPPLKLNGYQRQPIFLDTKANVLSSVPIPVAANGSADQGIYVVAMRPIGYQPKSRYDSEGYPLSLREQMGASSGSGDPEKEWSTSLVQLTDLAVTIKQSPGNVVVAVTSLASSQPATGAGVELYADGKKYWSGKTDTDGLAWASPHPNADCASCNLVAVVQHKGDLAYAQSRWRPSYDAYDGEDGLVGGDRYVSSLFADRGVYKVGEQVHVKGVVRLDTDEGLRIPPFREATVAVTDARDVSVHRAKVKVNERGAFESAFAVPADGSQGTYRVEVAVPGERRSGGGADPEPLTVGSTSFLVASFRRPEFRVDVAAPAARSEIQRGETFESEVEGRYLFGAAMAGRDVSWTLRASPSFFDPAAGHPALRLDGYSWQYYCHFSENCFDIDYQDVASGEGRLDDDGHFDVRTEIVPDRLHHGTQAYQLEAVVTDVNRQAIANRTSVLVHPGQYYAGVRLASGFLASGQPIEGNAVALMPGGRVVTGEQLTVRLTRWDWVTAKRLTGDDSTLRDGSWRRTVVATKALRSGAKPVPFRFDPQSAGSYVVDVIGQDTRGNRIEAGTELYVTGSGYVPWDLPEDDSVTLRVEKPSYAVGDTARVLVQSPWPTSDALVTVERGSVRSATRVQLTGSSATVEVPVRDEDAPNTFVSVTLFKGRTAPPSATQPDDPGRPQVRTGIAQINVPPVAKSLSVEITPTRRIARPATQVRATVKVRDANGVPAKAAAITLWAVDEGVLRLTGYRTPDLLADLYPYNSHDVLTTDSRLRLLAISTDDKGEEGDLAPGAPQPGGGGGDEAEGADGVRQDFRVLALWKGEVVADERGEATVAFTLPESLTTYRLLATALQGDDRFGGGSSEVQVTKPFQVRPALPRFFTPGDVVEAGAVLQNDTGKAASATVSLQLPAGGALRVEGPASRTVTLAPGATEVRFLLRAERVGSAAVTFQGALGDERDAVRVTVPIVLPQRTEATAAAGVVEAGTSGRGSAAEQLRLPASVYAETGGLSVGVSTSALAGLQNGIQELVEYPYGCLEQRSSRLRVLLMISDLQAAFPIPQLAGTKLRDTISAEIRRIGEYETSTGGLAYWPGDEQPDVYLTARVLTMLVDARKLGYRVPAGLVDRVSSYLQELVDHPDNVDDLTGQFLAHNRAHVLFALAHAGKVEKARIEALFDDRADLSVLERIHLLGAMGEAGVAGDSRDRLLRELRNSVRIEADRAYLQDDDLTGTCPCLSYLFAGNVHDTAAFLSATLKIDRNDRLAPMMVRWLLAQRKNGTWQNTLENGYALSAMVEFYRAQEATVPALDAQVRVGASTIGSRRFDGRSLDTALTARTLQELLAAGIRPGEPVPLNVAFTGTGRLYYTARLQYAPQLRTLAALDKGFTVERSYHPFAEGAPASTAFQAGDLVRVRLKVTTAQVRENVVIDDPLPAGLEALDARLSSTSEAETAATGASASSGIDHTELRDDRVLLFATRLPPGTFTYSYVARATSPGTFQVAPVQAQEMYRPEIFGRNAFTSFAVRVPGASAAPGAGTAGGGVGSLSAAPTAPAAATTPSGRGGAAATSAAAPATRSGAGAVNPAPAGGASGALAR